LKERYHGEVKEALGDRIGAVNPMRIPTFSKIVVNMGVGDAIADAKLIDAAVDDLTTITGQRPRVNRARKSIANFKLREGMPVGVSATLRGNRMWEFLDRLISIAIPRIRDFRGLNPKAFDGRGNYTFGVTEQLIFPEIDYDKLVKVRGMDVTICTTADNDADGRALLEAFGFPFRRQEGGA
jgi:large subunit ribosomal protein L5